MPEHLAAIALGSNLSSPFGDRTANLREALHRMNDLGQVEAKSSFLDTAPEVYTAQPRFLNAAALLRTALAPEALMEALLAIETAMGRVRTGVPAKGPRVIDLDLLLVDACHVNTPRLQLPHPALAERAFVLAPLAEIAPDWRHPVLGSTVAELLRSYQSKQVCA